MTLKPRVSVSVTTDVTVDFGSIVGELCRTAQRAMPLGASRDARAVLSAVLASLLEDMDRFNVDEFLAGPMVGHCTVCSLSFWLRTKHASMYCSDACKQKACRRRKKEAS